MWPVPPSPDQMYRQITPAQLKLGRVKVIPCPEHGRFCEHSTIEYTPFDFYYTADDGINYIVLEERSPTETIP